MNLYFSDVFDVSEERIENYGAFNKIKKARSEGISRRAIG